MPYSWALETPLSNFETRIDNSFRARQDPVDLGQELGGQGRQLLVVLVQIAHPVGCRRVPRAQGVEH